jgi:hypothetical protein
MIIGEKKTRGYTHMLDVWDMPNGEFIFVEVENLLFICFHVCGIKEAY